MRRSFSKAARRLVIFLAIRRVKAGKNHRFQFYISGQRLHRRMAVAGQSVADTAFVNVLESGGDIAHLTGVQGFKPAWERD